MITQVGHSLEHVFDLEANTTVLPSSGVAHVSPTPPAVAAVEPDESYDTRDAAIQSELDTIQATAMALATSLQQTMEFSEPRLHPRLGEISVQALGAAIEVMKQKIDIKKHKDKLHINGGVDKITNTQHNTLVIDRNDLLKQLLGKK